MKAYSQDLRDRVIALYKTKKYTKTELTKIFKLSYKTVFEWIKRYEESNDYSSKQHIANTERQQIIYIEEIIDYNV